jgi:D-erythro-7,8-dihydroneopterin triphosphate epimerase
MIATITIPVLRLKTIIGTKPAERKKSQTLLVDIKLTYDAAPAIANDCLTLALDYDTLTKKIIRQTSKACFYLMESLCSRILDIILKEKKVLSATVCLHKPGAIKNCQPVSVEMTKKKRAE